LLPAMGFATMGRPAFCYEELPAVYLFATKGRSAFATKRGQRCYKGDRGRIGLLQWGAAFATNGGRCCYEARPVSGWRRTWFATRGGRRQTGLLRRGAAFATTAERCCFQRLPTLLQRCIGTANRTHRRCYRGRCYSGSPGTARRGSPATTQRVLRRGYDVWTMGGAASDEGDGSREWVIGSPRGVVDVFVGALTSTP
jgi:hypothetical protein